MSVSPQKPPVSNVTCRYWATSGTCFFGDQCNFAHNPADRAATGKSVPKREKACKELLLTGYCKNEKNGCEYNHEIPGVIRAGPPASSTTAANVSTSVVYSSWSSTASSSLSSGAVAAIRNHRLPVSAPAFVPAAVAAAQRASLSAWGGVTPGKCVAVTSQATSTTISTTQNDSLSVSSGQTSVVDTQTTSAPGSLVEEAEVSGNPDTISSGISVSTSLSSFSNSLLNAQPFIPSISSAISGSLNGPSPPYSGTTQGASVGSANATPFVPSGGSVASAVSAVPFVPRSRQHLVTGATTGGGSSGMGWALQPVSSSLMALGGPAPQQQLQIRQHQLSQLQQQIQQQVAAQAQVQAQLQAQVQAQAQAQAHMLAAAARGISGSVLSNNQYMGMDMPTVLPSFRLPDGDDPALGMTAMSPPNPSFSTRAQLLQHMQNMQLQQQHQAFSGQSSPYSLRSLQRTGAQTPEKQQQLLNSQSEVQQSQSPPYAIWLSQSLGTHTPEKSQPLALKADAGGSVSSSLALSNDNQVQEHVLPSTPERRESDQLSVQSLEHIGPPQSPQQTGQIQSPQQQPTAVSQSSTKQQQQAQIQHQIQLQALQQQRMRHRMQQQQQQQQQQQHFQQGQRVLTGTGLTQQRLPSVRSPSPISGSSPVAAATHGGATYFLGPGQGISSLSHAFSSPVGRNESRTARSQFPAGTVPFGSRFLPDQLREELRRRHSLIHAQLDPEQDLVDLPEMVQRFHSLYPLEDVNREDEIPSASFGVRTMLFKGISSSDGQAYAIRRIDSHQVIPTAELANTAVEVVERWAPFARHPHIVAIRESFVSREVEDSAALFFVHDYYPAALTLQAIHLQQEQPSGVVHLTVNEEQLWSYMVQLATVLRAVHSAGLYFRPGGLHPSKVILTSKGRIRVSGVGILDVLHGDPSDDPRMFQREDLAGCGRLILALACGSTANASLEFMGSHYSADLVRITQALLASSPEKSEGAGICSIRQLCSALADRMFNEIENVHMQNDENLNELSKETENGRLLRILVKLGMINERPEHDMDPAWSEIGDRYLLKLFRDSVFHQTSEEGTPVIDWGHVVECLNKLDAGVPEKLILLSRDERSMLIASYADLKRCLENVYQELLASGDKARQAPPQNMLMQSPVRLSQRLHVI
ncbi:uncharacterized protein [Physcomitrium patens]|uniref:uncharacterized protein isoform X3 n=1 Tax=Physcomitrium patens TaxID=3218 RepID=UPI000D175DA5|nr:PAN2-PAN3 deadenylation complex subunit pan3-like isoform X3 [Physcomitrium patens]|eukprot:XP_024398844.1 PAN2-PAN3 deadenylation complex subunit pan3-like isoform X3 [Physcomitrella patens]